MFAWNIAVKGMHLRVKRQKTTIFVETDPKESILEVKGKLQKLLDGKVRRLLHWCI